MYVLRNRSTVVSEISQAEPEVKRYIADLFSHLQSMEIISEAITAVLDIAETPGTHQTIFRTIQAIGSLRIC